MLATIKDKNIDPPIYSFKLALKASLIASCVVLSIIAILNFLFLPYLAEERINHAKVIGETTSILIAELTKDKIDENNQELLNGILTKILRRAQEKEKELLQLSIILYPSGTYHASSTKQYLNRRIHSSLLKKIRNNKTSEITSETLKYKINDRTFTALQFLKNIYSRRGEGTSRVAVVQVLFDYDRIINDVRQKLLIGGFSILLLVIATILILLLPFSAVQRDLLEALNQLGDKNFAFRLPASSNDEIGLLYRAVNFLSHKLKREYDAKQSPQALPKKEDLTQYQMDNISIRKLDVTCLCARVPDLMQQVADESAVIVSESVNDFLAPLNHVVRNDSGRIAKIIGDKVYVIFEGVNGVDNAIHSALKIHQAWQEVNHERKVLGRPLLNFGIGLHCSKSVIGAFKDAEVNYAILGESMNQAAFLCSSARQGTVLISATTVKLANGPYDYSIHTPLVYPGTSREIDVFLLKTIERDQQSSKEAYEASLLGAVQKPMEGTIPDMLDETFSNEPLEMIPQEDENSEDFHDLPSSIHGLDDGMDSSTLMWDGFTAKPHRHKK